MALTDKLTAIADAIRAKKGSTAIFTLDQMAVEIEGIVTGNDLPNAEDTVFGTVSGYEYGIMSADAVSGYLGGINATYGYKFKPTVDFAVYGARIYANEFANGYESTLELWDVETGTILASTKEANVVNEWANGMFATPVNVYAGKEYIVSARDGKCISIFLDGTITYNSKITGVSNLKDTEGGMPDSEISSKSGRYASVDIIIGPILAESVVTEHKIQKDTMTMIADEVMRITGTTTSMTPAQIITALQGIAVQTTE